MEKMFLVFGESPYLAQVEKHNINYLLYKLFKHKFTFQFQIQTILIPIDIIASLLKKGTFLVSFGHIISSPIYE